MDLNLGKVKLLIFEESINHLYLKVKLLFGVKEFACLLIKEGVDLGKRRYVVNLYKKFG